MFTAVSEIASCESGPVEIVSTVADWQELAEIPSADDRAAAWLTSYEAKFPSVFDVYYSAWGNPEGRWEAAAQAPELRDQIVAAEARARHLLGQAEEEFRDRGLLEGDELHAVLLVGGHTSNGWVAEHDGRRSLFLALEFLGVPPYDDLLVVHELTHVAQAQRSAATRSRTYAASLAAMVEGAATATSRVLRPGYTDSAYLWMDEYHEDWLQECESSRQAIASLLMQHADTPDDNDTVAPLFRNRAGPGVPARSGYWAGDLVARDMLQEGCGLRGLLSVGPRGAHDRVVDWATRNH